MGRGGLIPVVHGVSTRAKAWAPGRVVVLSYGTA